MSMWPNSARNSARPSPSPPSGASATGWHETEAHNRARRARRRCTRSRRSRCSRGLEAHGPEPGDPSTPPTGRGLRQRRSTGPHPARARDGRQDAATRGRRGHRHHLVRRGAHADPERAQSDRAPPDGPARWQHGLRLAGKPGVRSRADKAQRGSCPALRRRHGRPPYAPGRQSRPELDLLAAGRRDHPRRGCDRRHAAEPPDHEASRGGERDDEQDRGWRS